MKKLLLLTLLIGCKRENKAIEFVQFVNPDATCEAMSVDTAVCRIVPKDGKPSDAQFTYCTASGDKAPSCEAYGSKPAPAPAPTPTAEAPTPEPAPKK